MSKYQHWHDQIIERSRARKPLACYFETHHILPRSLGGDDFDSNLAHLTYREHFLVHWLLTKLHSGGALRRTQMALHAMTLRVQGRIIAEWQVKVGRRAVSLLEDDPEMWIVRGRSVVVAREARRHSLMDKGRKRSSEREQFTKSLSVSHGLRPDQLDAIASKLLGLHKRVKIPTRHSSDKSEEEKRILSQLRKQRRGAKAHGRSRHPIVRT